MGKRKRNPFNAHEHIKGKASAVGNYIEVKGEEWGAPCEPADREKTFKLIVTDFCAMRDGKEWDDGVLSAGYQLTEAGPKTASPRGSKCGLATRKSMAKISMTLKLKWSC